MKDKPQFDLDLLDDEDIAVPESMQEVGADLFITQEHHQLLQQLSDAAEAGGSIQVIEGLEGSGKTTLARVLCQDHLTHRRYLGFLSPSFDDSLEQVIHQAASAFDLSGYEGAPVGEIIATLRHFSQSPAVQSDGALLVVDDAQHLDSQTITTLASLLAGTESARGLHLMLWSEPGLVERLDEILPVDVPLHNFRMPLLTPLEVNAYVKQCWLGEGLSAAEVQRLWVESGGCIGPLKALLEEELMPRDIAKKSLSFFVGSHLRNLPVWHLAAIVVLVLLLVGTFWISGDQTESSPARVESADVERFAASLDLTGEPATDAQAAAIPVSPATSASSPSRLVTKDDLSLEPVVDDEELRQAIYGQPVAKPATSQEEGVGGGAEKSSEKSSEKSAALRSDDAQALLGFAPQSYSLQVMAATSRESIEAFRAEQVNRSELYLYATQRKNQQWFVLLAGNYASKDAATRAVSSLPDSQKKAGPWPRQLAVVHAEIEED